MSPITTHILDISQGRPAAAVKVTLEFLDGREWRALARGETNADGRVTDLLPAAHRLQAGTYFERLRLRRFHPFVQVVFSVEDPAQHYHVPLVVSPFGYSTYRGS
jgi:5-hydroxyisourate hydrolase